MNKILQHKYWWIAMLLLFPAITYVSSLFRYRIDLTAEKRFSLTEPTKTLLNNLDSTINIKVFLTGDLPADYKKLSIATQDILNEFRDLSNNQVQVSYENPGEGLDDSSKIYLYDSLSRLGVVFEQTQNVSAANDKATNQLIIPSALVSYGNRKPFGIDLRSSRKVFKNFNVVNDIPQEDKEATLNAAEALLEFKFANAIDKLTRTYVPVVAYAVGNGEPVDYRINDLGESLRNDYRLAIFDLKQGYPDPQQIDAILIVKPTQPFTDEDKLKIDQYVMHGGKVVWCIDKLYAELDSLMRSQNDFVAFDRNLNVDDILFKYGVRINGDLLQDLNCAKIPIVVGQNPDGSPQMQRFPWPYYPFLNTTNNNPISKNLDRVLPIFPSSIDTVEAPGIQKTILLATDTNSRRLTSPAMVTLNSIKDDADFATFNKSYVPVAVLLEGNFTSLYANRLTKAIQDSVTRAAGKAFARVSEKPTKQIVISDADIVTNAVSQSTGPLAMGEIPFENYRFANREFFLNSIDYLLSNNGIFQARNKDFTLRLLDKKKTEEQRSMWQLINITLPIVVILLFGALYQWRRKQKYNM
jgi:ABC-2 type transport system permease protein